MLYTYVHICACTYLQHCSIRSLSTVIEGEGGPQTAGYSVHQNLHTTSNYVNSVSIIMVRVITNRHACYEGDTIYSTTA